MAGKIVIDAEKCKGCGLCVEVCPKGAVRISKNSNAMGYFPVEPCGDSCIGCGSCAVMCPDVAIEVFRDSVHEVASGASHPKTLIKEKM